MIDFNGINFVISFVVSFYYCKACMLEWTNKWNTNKQIPVIVSTSDGSAEQKSSTDYLRG